MTNQLALRDDMSLSELGKVFVESGFFQDTRQASQAIVKVLAGRELGFGPIASMTGVYVIQGRISMSANLLAAAIKRTGKYNFLVKEMTDAVCKIEYREKIDGKWEVIGVSEFTAADAKRAMTKNMDKFPRNMLYARAMSNGARWYCPDVFGGPVYTPEEMGADVTEDGEVIHASFIDAPTESTEPETPPMRVVEPPAVVDNVRTSNITPTGNGHDPADKSKTCKIGKNSYPYEWGVAFADPKDGIFGRIKPPHVDGILQILALDDKTMPEVVRDVVIAYADAKDRGEDPIAAANYRYAAALDGRDENG